MVLVPENAYSSMIKHKQEETHPLVNELVRLNTQLSDILNDSTLAADVKYAKYNEVLQRYLFLKGQQFGPLNPPTPIQSTATTTTTTTSPKTNATSGLKELPIAKATSGFIHSLAQSYKTAGGSLAKHLEENSEKFKIDDKQQLIYNGTPIENSNIVDLMDFFTRSRKYTEDIPGVEQFSKLLKETNAPQRAFQNKSRYRQYFAQSPADSDRSHSGPVRNSSKKNRRAQRRSRGNAHFNESEVDDEEEYDGEMSHNDSIFRPKPWGGLFG